MTAAEQTPLHAFLARIGPIEQAERWIQPRTGSECRVVWSPVLEAEVFVKSVPERIGAAIARDFRSLDALHKGAPGTVPEPLAWGEMPAYVAYRWVAGMPLSELLTDHPDEAAEQALRAVGDALARVHAVEAVAVPGQTDIAVNSVSAGELVPSIVDLGPWNCIVHGDASVFIDLQLRVAAREFDVGRLTAATARVAAGPGAGVRMAMKTGRRTRRLLGAGYDDRCAALGARPPTVRRVAVVNARRTLAFGLMDIRRGPRGWALRRTVGLLLAAGLDALSVGTRHVRDCTTSGYSDREMSERTSPPTSVGAPRNTKGDR